MRTTASYELFPDAPSERAMARARYLVREGRVADAEKAYRDLLAEHPDLKTGWAECFELLRSQGRTEDALRLAEGARAQFGDSAFSLALKGAALIELTRYRDALATLEQALEIAGDRKSTRLNSSHDQISYAVFCLKKKTGTSSSGSPAHRSGPAPRARSARPASARGNPAPASNRCRPRPAGSCRPPTSPAPRRSAP